jgi:small subunit ribosomal protein S2
MYKIPTMEEMLKAGCHFGHQAAHWHPHMEPFIYTTRNGVHIIDLKKTQEKLQKAMEFVSQTVAAGGDILFVGSKVQALPLIEKAAKEVNMPYAKSRWIGGTMTNFNAVKKSIDRYLNLLRQRDGGEWEKYTKKERAELQKEIDRLHSMVSGLATMKSLPKAMFVVDVRTEQSAVKEANVMHVPIVAVCDTNVNPKFVKHVIPCNDDATRGISMMLDCMVEAIKDGLKHRKVVPQAVAKPAFVRKAAPVAAKPAAPKAAVKAVEAAPAAEAKKPAKATATKRVTKKAKA